MDYLLAVCRISETNLFFRSLSLYSFHSGISFSQKFINTSYVFINIFHLVIYSLLFNWTDSKSTAFSANKNVLKRLFHSNQLNFSMFDFFFCWKKQAHGMISVYLDRLNWGLFQEIRIMIDMIRTMTAFYTHKIGIPNFFSDASKYMGMLLGCFNRLQMKKMNFHSTK